MAIQLIKDDIQFTGIGSDGKKSATRLMVLSYGENDNSMDFAESELLPNINDLHPDYPAWHVSGVKNPQWSESPRIITVEVEYSMGGSSSSGGGGGSSKGKKPWELGVQNFQSSIYDIEEPLLYIYDPQEDQIRRLENTAGDQIIATTQKTVRRITFQVHYKHKAGKMAAQNDDYSYNKDAVKVCNIEIPPYAGKLMPFGTTLHTVYKSNGSVDYEYETAEITIDIRMKDTWLREFLNVGTQAKFTDSTKGAVFRFYDLKNKNDLPSINNMNFGSMAEMITARKKYVDAGENPFEKSLLL